MEPAGPSRLKIAALVLGGVALVLASGLAVYGAYRYREASRETVVAREEAERSAARAAELETQLASTTEANADLEETLRTEQKKNDSFEKQISKIAGTVGTLEKLSRTDKQLLEKYSKVYFLNEHYAPPSLGDIPTEYSYGGKALSFHGQALPYLESMLEAAAEDGIDLRVISAYRSFGTQAVLKSSYRVTYGSGANAFSADQGYSEHQLGTTVDLTTPEVGATFANFEKTEAYDWLQRRAYRYGFVLSYPAGNDYYQFEPWHWRFVGRDLARELSREDQSFYDMDQREIDAYLVDIFD